MENIDEIAIKRLLHEKGYLYQTGWLESFKSKEPCSLNGDPLPWYTYSAISFIEDRIIGAMKVFEYGSGNSTLWWSKQVSHVVSCEHDKEWFDKIKNILPDNVEYLFVDLDYDGEYSKRAKGYSEFFDIIVIDGRDRINCAKNCLNALKKDGVIIWDNSDREKYNEGYEFLRENSFKQLDFSGIGPINNYGWCTSIFYRNENCFMI